MVSVPSYPDLWLWGADYSQLEIRIFARVTKCRAMIETYQAGGDLHALTAHRVFGIPPDELPKYPDLRTRAKTLNFGIAYGAEADTVQETILKVSLRDPEKGIKIPSLDECREMVKGFWRAYPEAEEWVTYMKGLFRRQGYAEDIFKRRRYLPDLLSWNSDLRARAERQGINHCIQGPAGTITKNAQLMIWRDIPRYPQYRPTILQQVHDELWGTVRGPKYELETVWLPLVKSSMELGQMLRPVPLLVEPKLVKSWAELK